MRPRQLLLFLALLMAALMALTPGCESSGGPRFEPPAVVPTYPEVARRFNARVERLDRVWASVVVTLRTPKESGGTTFDQAEGYLQVEQPENTALSIMKLGETYFYMGSNEAGYWWLDMSDGDQKVALYGLHEEATPELVEQLGLPVHPLELLELFAITDLPTAGEDGVAPGVVAWDAESGMLRVTVPARWGSRVLWLDPVLMAPYRVEIRDQIGRARAVCELDRYESVPIFGDGRLPAKMASQYRVRFPETGSRATLQLYGLSNKPISPRAFDFENLSESYGIDEVYLLRPERAGG